MNNKLDEKIYVAGHCGMVGSAILRGLKDRGFSNLLTRTHDQLDLTNQAAVSKFFEEERPAIVYLAAAKVGGIHANNTFPADFIYQNLMIASNVIHHSFVTGVKRLLCLGSSCIYPKLTPQPMIEGALLKGALEPTNEPYAIAKIAGIKLCESYNRQYADSVDFRTAMPTNLYGPGDNYHPKNSHVIPALIRRIHEAKINGDKEVILWGTGTPKREFLYVDDMASAAIHIMNIKKTEYEKNILPMQSHLNIGSGSEISMENLALEISRVIGYKGSIVCDASKVDGAPRKLLDSSKLLNLGWRPQVTLSEGIKISYEDYIKNVSEEL